MEYALLALGILVIVLMVTLQYITKKGLYWKRHAEEMAVIASYQLIQRIKEQEFFTEEEKEELIQKKDITIYELSVLCAKKELARKMNELKGINEDKKVVH